MIRRFISVLLVLAFMAVGAKHADAQVFPIGNLCNASQLATIGVLDFGGTNIPLTGAYCSQFQNVLIGVSFSGRYSSPPVTTDFLGTFYSTPGNSTGGPVDVGFARWNGNTSITGALPTDVFRTFFDLNPAYGVSTPSAGLTSFGNSTDSFNMGYLPSGFFNNNLLAQYTVSVAYCGTDQACLNPIIVTQANLEVTADGQPPVTTTPEPATMMLTASGIIGIGGFVRRRRRLAA